MTSGRFQGILPTLVFENPIVSFHHFIRQRFVPPMM
jgi:hypothetical protein